VLCLLVAGCMPTPKHNLAAELYDRLIDIRADLVRFENEVSVPCGEAGENSKCSPRARSDAVNARCNPAGEVRGKLYADVGPSDIPGLYAPLADATDAVLAACGQLWLLQFAYRENVIVNQAHIEWRAGFDQELRASCAFLQVVATRLSRPQADCATSSS
jgi:hypothetical protein